MPWVNLPTLLYYNASRKEKLAYSISSQFDVFTGLLEVYADWKI